MSLTDSGDSFSSMLQIQTLTDEAIQFLTAHHRHKTIFLPDCPECVMKRMLVAIKEEAEKAIPATS